MTESTLRNFDSDFREWCEEEAAAPGCECRRFMEEGGDAETVVSTACGDTERTGETLVDAERGGENGGDCASAQAALASGKNPPVLGAQEFLPDAIPSLLSSSGVEDVRGLGDDDGTFAMTERGGRIEKI